MPVARSWARPAPCLGRAVKEAAAVRHRSTITASSGWRWADRVIPLRGPWIGGDVEGRHLLVGNADRLGICVLIQLAAHRQSGLGRGGGDKIDDSEATEQWLAAPGLGDVAEHAMLDLVPLR